jgi:2-oxoisovalerate dehydrogenase E2 component (dihydrolipoyl transacylase)
MGATFVVKVPDIGEGVVEAELVGWHVQVGDAVREDQVLAEVMTDKATVEIPAPCAGRVTALGGDVGAKLVVGGELLRLEAPGGAAAEEARATEPPPPEPATPAPPPAEAPAAEVPRAPVEPAPALAAEAEPPRPGAKPGTAPLAAPAVRKRAQDLGLDLRGLRGSGPEGRITHADLDAALRRDGAAPPPAARDEVEEVPVFGLRRRIAERMAEATRRVAHFSYVEEVDMTAVEALRATLNAEAPVAERPKLTPLPFLMLAVTRAVAGFPQMNAHYDEEAGLVRRHRAVHLGVATQTEGGLMVPVLRHAEARGLWELAAELKRLAAATRAGSAKREELGGSTITITSLGALGGIASTPVVNIPEVAIIGTGRIVARPVWQEGAGFVPRQMMNLSSSFDHRVVDGYDAAAFIQRIRGLLESPALLFLDPH